MSTACHLPTQAQNAVAKAVSYIHSGARPAGADALGRTAVHWAAEFDSIESLQAVENALAQLRQAATAGLQRAGWSAEDAATATDEQMALPWHARDKAGNSALHAAAAAGNVRAVQVLLAHDVSPNEADAMGCTPLHEYVALLGMVALPACCPSPADSLHLRLFRHTPQSCCIWQLTCSAAPAPSWSRPHGC